MTFTLFPRTVFKTISKFSGEIIVKDWLGSRTLNVKGLVQSGGLVSGIWKKALKRIRSQVLSVTNVLVLGLGGGTVVQLIKKYWPEAKIVGIEIDQEIIKIGKNFFGLNEVKNLENLEIINADAIKWVADFDTSMYRSGFDLVVVDLYLGGKFPKEAESEKFLKNIKKLLAKNGVVIFNRLKTDKTRGFKEKLEKHFSSIKKIKTSTNYFFIAGN